MTHQKPEKKSREAVLLKFRKERHVLYLSLTFFLRTTPCAEGDRGVSLHTCTFYNFKNNFYFQISIHETTTCQARPRPWSSHGLLSSFVPPAHLYTFTEVGPWMKEEKGIRHRGEGAYLRCPVSTSVQFSLRNEGSSEYICVCEGRESLRPNF
jgi:hypothetical protein